MDSVCKKEEGKKEGNMERFSSISKKSVTHERENEPLPNTWVPESHAWDLAIGITLTELVPMVAVHDEEADFVAFAAEVETH